MYVFANDKAVGCVWCDVLGLGVAGSRGALEQFRVGWYDRGMMRWCGTTRVTRQPTAKGPQSAV